ncbi:MAG: chemotaxis protein CheW, partial [Thermosynechococcaceae cyanobacterium]
FLAESLPAAIGDRPVAPIATDFYSLYCPEADVADRAIFQKRAAELKQSHDAENRSAATPIAVVGLGGEYYGVDLNTVKEFIDLPKVSPIPCSPAHLLGNLNLRGEVVALIDIQSVLNLHRVQKKQPKAVIAQVGEIVAGISIDDVYDILYLNAHEISEDPNQLSSQWIRGFAPYRNATLSLLDLPRLFQSDALCVNETA